jgi:hypothetical protein
VGTHAYFSEKRTWDAINGVLCRSAFTPAIDKAIKERFNTAFAGMNPPKIKIQIMIQTFGLIESKAAQQHCLVASARLTIHREHGEPKQEQLLITDLKKSKDAPPPQCASLDRFAENGARWCRIPWMNMHRCWLRWQATGS